MTDTGPELTPWESGRRGKFLIDTTGELHHWEVDDHGNPSYAMVRHRLGVASLMAGEIDPTGDSWHTERDASGGPIVVERAFAGAPLLTHRGRRSVEVPAGEWGRDPARISMILRALEREWRKAPDFRLGQLLINLLRRHTDLADDREGTALFAVEDRVLLQWLGPQTEEEMQYIAEEPRKARRGWTAWDRQFRQSDAYKEWRNRAGREQEDD